MKTRKKVIRTRRRKLGGVLIGEGKTAKTIYPAIPCKDGKDLKGYVSRIVKEGKVRDNPRVDLISNNKELVSKLMAIDPHQKYFFYPITCEMGELLEENVKDGVKKETLNELYLKGKMTWKKYISEIGDAPVPKKQLNHIFKSFDKLHKSGILHGDIHSDNIVLADDNLPRIIDFGSAIYDSPKKLITTEGKLIREIKPTFDTEIINSNPEIRKLRINNRMLRFKILTRQRGF
jgi:hypothetical protein